MMLKSKVTVPFSKPSLIFRQRLIDSLSESENKKLTLVSAPAGFGKTTLVGEWVRYANKNTIWLSLDEKDNDYISFIQLFGMAIMESEVSVDLPTIDPLIAQGNSSFSSDLEDSILKQLFITLSSFPDDITIVFDDFHHIQNVIILDELEYILSNSPPNINTIIVTRTDPPLKLARLRTQFSFSEIRGNDLAFNPIECSTYLNIKMGLELNTEEIEMLLKKFEGWPAGLQLAAILLENHKNKSRMIEAISGTNKFILDYLMEEIIGNLEPETYDFLLKTSILDQFNGSLCETLTQNNNSLRIIEDLVKNNMFIIQLDNEMNWFRYHHLFSDLLRSRIARQNDIDYQDLHFKAAKWFEENNNFESAITHYLLSGDFQQANFLLEGKALEWMAQGNLRHYEKLLSSVSETDLQKLPWAIIALAWILTGRANPTKAEKLVESYQGKLSIKIQAHFDLILSFCAYLSVNSKDCLAFAESALDKLDQTDLYEIVTANTLIACSLHSLGNIKKAQEVFETTLEYSKLQGDPRLEIIHSASYAYFLFTQGKLFKAQIICEESIRRNALIASTSLTQSLRIGYLYGILSGILLQKCELDLAESYARKGYSITRSWEHNHYSAQACDFLAEVLATKGQVNEALEVISKAKELAINMPVSYQNMVNAWEANILLLSKRPNLALSWIHSDPISIHDDPLSAKPNWKYLVLVQALLKNQQFDGVLGAINRLTDHYQQIQAHGNTIFLLVLKSSLLFQTKEIEGAKKTIHDALKLAAPENNILFFILAGPPIEELLSQIKNDTLYPAFVNQILHSFAQQHQISNWSAYLPESLHLIEQLSNRELEILNLLSTEKTPKEIAEQLFLSLSTVNTHIQNVYRKLSVNRRYEAVSMAKEAGLIKEQVEN